MNNTLLYSQSELSMLRANKQAQRQLDSTCRQMDTEKGYVNRDWNNRMKHFLSQKKKMMPKGWDHTRYRSSNAWPDPKIMTISNGVPQGDYGVPTMRTNKIPRAWQLQASYVKLADGRLIQRTTCRTDNRYIPRKKTEPIKPLSEELIKPRRAVSAPVSRRYCTTPRPVSAAKASNSFLVTQIELENEIMNSGGGDDVFLHQDLNLSNHLQQLHYKQRPLSAMSPCLEPGKVDLRHGVARRPRSSFIPRSSPRIFESTLEATKTID